MRARAETQILKAMRRGMPWMLLIFALGCATGDRRTPKSDEAATSGPEGPPVTTEEVVRHEGGFTITQQMTVEDDVRADYQTALLMLRDGRYEPAIAALLAVTDRAPTAVAAHLALGVAYARVGDLDLAEASLRRTLELSPEHPVAYNELALVQRRKGQFGAARETYETSLARFPGFHYAHRNLGILCELYLGDHACALSHYEAYSRIAPDDAEVGKWIVDLRRRGAQGEAP